MGEDVDHMSDTEENLLSMPLPGTDCDGEVNLPDSTEPLLSLFIAQKFVEFVEPVVDPAKWSKWTMYTANL